MTRSMPLVLPVMLALGACGFTSYGRRVDPRAIAQVKPCQSTRAEALRLLGEPYKTGSVGELDTLIYEYGGADGTDRLQIALDKGARVVDVAHNADFGYQPKNRCAAVTAGR